MGAGGERDGAIRPGAVQEGIHLPFIYAALALAILLGFTLAISLPLEVAIGTIDLGWLAHAQVHGHVQVVGFAGLFVIGVAARLAPRFGVGELSLRWLLRPAWWLLVVGVLARAIGQPVAEHAPFATLLAVGAAAEAAGSLLVLLIFARTLAPWRRGAEPHAVLLAMAMVWLAVQAAIGWWWLTELATDGEEVLAPGRNTVLLQMQVFGFLGSALLGVGMRSFPTFFGASPPAAWRSWAVVALTQGGLVLWTAGAFARADDPSVSPLIASVGQGALGVGILLHAVGTGWWAWRHRLAAASTHLIWGLRPLLASLTLTGVMLLLSAAEAIGDDRAVTAATLDATRHVFLVGVITLGILTMGQLILPEFASERLTRDPGRWRGPTFGLLLGVAVVLRGVLPWAGLASPDRYWGMAAAGSLAWVATCLFAVLLYRARRAHREYLARLSQMQSGQPLILRNTPPKRLS